MVGVKSSPVGPSGDQVAVGDGNPPPVDTQPGTQAVQGQRVSHTDLQLERPLDNQPAMGEGGRQGIADPHVSNTAICPPVGAPNRDGAHLSSTDHPAFSDGAANVGQNPPFFSILAAGSSVKQQTLEWTI